MTFFYLFAFILLFPWFKQSVVKARGSAAMRTCGQVPPTDFRGVVLDGDFQEKTHLTPTVKIVNIWGVLPQILLIPVAESLVIRLLPYFREHTPSGRTKGRNFLQT